MWFALSSRAVRTCVRLFGAVRICARSTGSIAKSSIGDLRDVESVERAVRGCDEVYHVAADYRLWVLDEASMYAANVGRYAQPARSVKARGRREDRSHQHGGVLLALARTRFGREDTPVTLEDMVGPYKRSKFLAERAALEAARAGLPVVIVNPSTPIGALDYKPTPTGRIIVEFLNRRMPAFMSKPVSISPASRMSRAVICWRRSADVSARNIFSAARTLRFK